VPSEARHEECKSYLRSNRSGDALEEHRSNCNAISYVVSLEKVGSRPRAYEILDRGNVWGMKILPTIAQMKSVTEWS